MLKNEKVFCLKRNETNADPKTSDLGIPAVLVECNDHDVKSVWSPYYNATGLGVTL
jgi:hypothetical protein